MAFLGDGTQKIKEESKNLHRKVRKQAIGYIIAACGLVVGLAWNEAIKSFIEYIFPLGGNSLFAKFIYAIILTLILVAATTYLLKATEEERE